MLLFEGSFGRMLHTGDFRWEAEYLADMLRHPALTSAAIDALFLDNTYAHPRYRVGASLSVCVAHPAFLIACKQCSSGCHVALFCHLQCQPLPNASALPMACSQWLSRAQHAFMWQ